MKCEEQISKNRFNTLSSIGTGSNLIPSYQLNIINLFLFKFIDFFNNLITLVTHESCDMMRVASCDLFDSLRNSRSKLI